MSALVRRALLALGIAATLLAPSSARAQASGTRFTITSVGDSTIAFATGSAAWVRKGLRGLAVDPRQRDVLVARFEVLEVRDNVALGLITGATRPLTPEDIAVLERPAPGIVRQRGFWTGVVLGLLGGLGLGLAI